MKPGADMRSIVRWIVSAALAAILAGSAQADEWAAYGRDPGGTRFSPLKQITPQNVKSLKPVWTFHTGDVADGKSSPRSGFETTPLMIGGRLYLTTPFNRIIALDPATGRQIWAYDPKIEHARNYGDGMINRGVAAWRDPAGKAACRLRLYEATLDARLIAVDAATGKPCAGFGAGGEVNLHRVKNYRVGSYHMTSPPVVVDGVVIVGSAINDNDQAEMPDGVVRGFDARTGKLLWSFAVLERPKGVAPEAWKTGAANAWSLLVTDPARHLVYLPTGSASPDYYGGLRPGDNHWANSVIALDTRTGKLAWGFQLVHHDVWDYDTAAAPLVTDFKLRGKHTPVLLAGNKTGMIYALDPGSGRPVLPIEERPVPQSDVPGETTSPTQPFSVSLPGLAPQSLTPDRAFGLNEADRRACQDLLTGLTGASLFTPPSIKGDLAVPGSIGGINWSGFAWDAGHGRLIVPVSSLPYKVRLISRDRFAGGDHGDPGAETAPQTGTPYAVSRGPLKAPSGLPCGAPPWGELVALDLAAGKVAWRVPLGSMEELSPGIGATAKGSIALGGPIVTAGGLIFIGGSLDRRFRAFSAETGEELWAAELPASAHATPITYAVGGKQYVVVAAGGSAKISEEVQGDALIAYALP
jgi:quinoprotein glucose dehydrogenase